MCADARSVLDILNNSFDSEDNQRILGERVMLALFKMLFRLDDALFLIAQEQQKTLGYIWIQLKALSFLRCFQNAPLETLGVIIVILKNIKLRSAFNFFKNQNKTNSLFVPYPKIVSLAVDKAARGKGMGTKLILETQKYLAGYGMTAFFVLTAKTNLAAISFYEKSGFERYKNNEVSVVFTKNLV